MINRVGSLTSRFEKAYFPQQGPFEGLTHKVSQTLKYAGISTSGMGFQSARSGSKLTGIYIVIQRNSSHEKAILDALQSRGLTPKAFHLRANQSHILVNFDDAATL